MVMMLMLIMTLRENNVPYLGMLWAIAVEGGYCGACVPCATHVSCAYLEAQSSGWCTLTSCRHGTPSPGGTRRPRGLPGTVPGGSDGARHHRCGLCHTGPRGIWCTRCRVPPPPPPGARPRPASLHRGLGPGHRFRTYPLAHTRTCHLGPWRAPTDPGTPHTHIRTSLLREKLEMYQRGPKLNTDFRSTNVRPLRETNALRAPRIAPRVQRVLIFGSHLCIFGRFSGSQGRGSLRG